MKQSGNPNALNLSVQSNKIHFPVPKKPNLEENKTPLKISKPYPVPTQPLSLSNSISSYKHKLQKNEETLKVLSDKYIANLKILKSIRSEQANLHSNLGITPKNRHQSNRKRSVNSKKKDFYRPDKEYTYEELLELGDRIGYVSKGLSEDLLSSLPLEAPLEETDCTICLLQISTDTMANKLLPCGHFYHCECIHFWLEQHKTCPLCLSEINF